jgi:hypothetical protein
MPAPKAIGSVPIRATSVVIMIGGKQANAQVQRAAPGKVEFFGALKPGETVVRRATDALQPGIKVQAKAS